jgi:hypothetical protein
LVVVQAAPVIVQVQGVVLLLVARVVVAGINTVQEAQVPRDKATLVEPVVQHILMVAVAVAPVRLVAILMILAILVKVVMV